MDLSKFTLALFDVFAYLLPGIALLGILSLMEATFLKSSLLPLSRLGTLPVLMMLVAYYLGHLVHALAVLLTERVSWLCAPKGGDLSDAVFKQLRNRVVKVYELDVSPMPNQKLATLDTYKLADSYIVAKDKTAERESLHVRAAFARSSMVVFALLSLLSLLSLLNGGLSVRVTDSPEMLGTGMSVVVTVFAGLAAYAFWVRFKYFTLLRRSSIYTLFMALTVKAS